ncbi:Protein of unknown function [Bacillus cereus]|nr:Protein of unknown function [Bacillus cereus]
MFNTLTIVISATAIVINVATLFVLFKIKKLTTT